MVSVFFSGGELAMSSLKSAIHGSGYHLIRGRCKMAANIVQQVEKLEVNSEEKQTLKAKSGLYEVSKPYHHEWLRVSDLHEIYYEEAGNKDGKPILFV